MSKPTILLIEPNDLLRDTLAAVLARGGLTVAPAASAPAALALVQPGCALPQLVVLDLFLKQINGLMLLKSLRQVAGLEMVPVIVLSTLGFSEIIEQAIAAGASDFVLKPFDPQLLLEKVNRAIQAPTR